MADVLEFSGKYRFLSNFWPAEVVLDGQAYPTVEHAYQAAKTKLKLERSEVRSAASPGIAKKLGRRVTIRNDWEEIKISVMESLLRQKFSDSFLAFKLLECDGEIVEGNYWNDTFWGICKGVGTNHLGKLLMKIRDDL